jgi:hypothetical protein
MSILQIVKFNALEQIFPAGMKPALQDQLHLSSYLFKRRRVRPTIRFVLTAPPLKRPENSMMFHAFATNRTAFGTIHDLEEVFAEWFLETRILPIINPVPMKYYEEPEMLPKEWYIPITKRGVGIYRYAP